MDTQKVLEIVKRTESPLKRQLLMVAGVTNGLKDKEGQDLKQVALLHTLPNIL